MSDTEYGLPTALDWIHAQAFAIDQVNKMKCQDPEIVKTVCEKTVPGTGKYMGGGTCIKWRQDISARSYPVPDRKYINTCSTDADCEMGKCDGGQCVCTTKADCSGMLDCIQDPDNPSTNVCGYIPDDVASGHCVFSTEQSCLAQGQLPYTCSDKTCTRRSKDDLKVPYTEWHTDDKGENGKCVLGNFVLRQWCEQPVSRCTIDKKTGKYPPGCEGSASEPGITDVPAFLYDVNRSACYMTHDYCRAYAMDYNIDTKCQTDVDCKKHNPNWFCKVTDQGGHCSGPESECYLPKGAKFGKMIVGKTLFYMFRNGFKSCDKKEGFTMLNEEEMSDKYAEEGLKGAFEKFNKIGQVVGALAEPSRMERKTLLMKNYCGDGINLYMVKWKGGKKPVVGLNAEEVQKKYPHLIEKHMGDRYVVIDRDEIKSDRAIKRMYLILGSKSWMGDLVTKIIFEKRKNE